MSEEHRAKLKEAFRLNHTGEKHWNWKGANASYSSLHDWVYSRLGRPQICAHCRRSWVDQVSLEWANKSGLYRREVQDWLPLCRSCHRIFDNKRKLGI